ncbi:MAG: tetratricopeptide repeat protein, partial [Bacteroidota bacterium]
MTPLFFFGQPSTPLPDTTAAHEAWNKGQQFKQAQNPQAAAPMFTQAMRGFYQAGSVSPDDTIYWIRGLGSLHEAMGQYSKLREYEAAIALNRETIELYDKLFPGNARKRVGVYGNWARYEYALERYDRAAEK